MQTNENQRFSDSQSKFSPSKPLRPLIQYYDYIFSDNGLQFNAPRETEKLETFLISGGPSILNEGTANQVYEKFQLQIIFNEIVNILHEKMNEERQHSGETCTSWIMLRNIDLHEAYSYAKILALYLTEQNNSNYVVKYLPFLLSCYICNHQKPLTKEYTEYLYSSDSPALENIASFEGALNFIKLKKNRTNLFHRYFGVTNLSFSKIECYVEKYAKNKTSNNLKSICRNIRNNYYLLLTFCICAAVCRKYLENKCDYTLSFILFSNLLWASDSNEGTVACPPDFLKSFLLFFAPAIISKEYQPVKLPGFYDFYELFDTFISIKHPFSEDNNTLLNYLSPFIGFSDKHTSLGIGLLESFIEPNVYYDFLNLGFKVHEMDSHSNVTFI